MLDFLGVMLLLSVIVKFFRPAVSEAAAKESPLFLLEFA
jgi:hypothetical protein